MRVEIVRRLRDPATRSVFGTIGIVGRDPFGVTCEREWLGNKRGESCVPAGFYVLEPHDGTKYKDTFALVGGTVSHNPEEGVARYACVFHGAKTGAQLQGCIAVGAAIYWTGAGALDESAALEWLLGQLRAEPGPSYLTIRDGF